MKLISLVAILASVLVLIVVLLALLSCGCPEETIQDCPKGQEISFVTEKQFLCSDCSVHKCTASPYEKPASQEQETTS